MKFISKSPLLLLSSLLLLGCGPSADLTLEEAASLLGQANFTMDALCDYEGGSIEYFDYVVSTDLVAQTYGDETYIYGSNGQYTCQAYLYDGALEEQSILPPSPGPTSPTISPTRPSISSARFPIGRVMAMGYIFQ